MKHKLLTASAALPLSLLLTWGSVYSMVTGLNLPVNDHGRLLLVWALCALAGCVLFSLPSGSLVALAGILAGGFWLWNVRGIALPIQALIARLSTIYNSAYGWGVLEFSGVTWQTTSLDLLLAAWGGLTALLTAGAVLRGRGAPAAAVLSLPPLIATMVVTDTPPDALPLLGMLVAIALVLLPASVARQNPLQGVKLTAIAALPTALVLGCLFLVFPKDTYVNRAEERLDAIVSWWNATFISPFQGGGLGQELTPTPTVSARTRLSSLGPRRVIPYPVMDVTADFDGVLYLRGQDYDVYDGLSWVSSLDRVEVLPSADNQGPRGRVTVTTNSPLGVIYLPSYLYHDQYLSDGRLNNEDQQTEFTWDVTIYTPSNTYSPPVFGSTFLPYLELPEATRDWAEDYVEQLLNEVWADWRRPTADTIATEGTGQTARAIAEYVSTTARYSLNPQRMDGDYDDFAQWFLTESDRGYCVHFATAATVLLRAAGIPARYVTGYMVTCEAGETVTVESDKAHAWVEYYDTGVNAWIIVEPTPPDSGEDEPETESATDPQPETQPLTKPEEEESTAPGAATGPAGQKPTQNSEKFDWAPLLAVLRWVVVTMAVLATVIAQRSLRLMLRRRTIFGDPNRRALGLWRDVERISKVLNQEPPEELLALAQKARFSQHTLTKEELHQFTEWLANARRELDQRPLPCRLWCQYVLALW